MKKILDITKTVLLFILILFVIFFSISNSDFVKVNFNFFPLNFSLEIRIFLLIILSFAIGFVCGIALTSYRLIGKYFEGVRDRRKVDKLEKDIQKLEENKVEIKENE